MTKVIMENLMSMHEELGHELRIQILKNDAHGARITAGRMSGLDDAISMPADMMEAAEGGNDDGEFSH
jgi:hypothetical protein